MALETERIVKELQKKSDKLKFAKRQIHQSGIKLPMLAKLLKDAEGNFVHYRDAVIRIAEDIVKHQKALEAAEKYVATHEDDADKVGKAEKIAKEIDKLMKKIAKLKEQAADE